MTGRCLLLWGTPPEVIRRIRPVIIYPIECFPLWSRRNICMEIGEIMPALANGNTSTAVSFISRCFGVVTALHHAAPNLLKRVFVKAMPRDRFLMVASAGRTAATSQRVPIDCKPISTVALAKPIGRTIGQSRRSLRLAENGKPPKALAGQVIGFVADATAGKRKSTAKIAARKIGDGAAIATAAIKRASGAWTEIFLDYPVSKSLSGNINEFGHAGLLYRHVGQVTGRRLRAVPLRILAHHRAHGHVSARAAGSVSVASGTPRIGRLTRWAAGLGINKGDDYAIRQVRRAR